MQWLLHWNCFANTNNQQWPLCLAKFLVQTGFFPKHLTVYSSRQSFKCQPGWYAFDFTLLSQTVVYEIDVFWARQWNIKFCLFNQNVLLLDKKRKATKLANGKALLTVVVFNVNLYACFWRCFGIANVCQYDLSFCVTGTRWAPTDCWSPKCNARAVARVTKTPAAKKNHLNFLNLICSFLPFAPLLSLPPPGLFTSSSNLFPLSCKRL